MADDVVFPEDPDDIPSLPTLNKNILFKGSDTSSPMAFQVWMIQISAVLDALEPWSFFTDLSKPRPTVAAAPTPPAGGTTTTTLSTTTTTALVNFSEYRGATEVETPPFEVSERQLIVFNKMDRLGFSWIVPSLTGRAAELLLDLGGRKSLYALLRLLRRTYDPVSMNSLLATGQEFLRLDYTAGSCIETFISNFTRLPTKIKTLNPKAVLDPIWQKLILLSGSECHPRCSSACLQPLPAARPNDDRAIGSLPRGGEDCRARRTTACRNCKKG